MTWCHDPPCCSASAMTRRIFLLSSGHQIVTFKAAAFVISALMFFVGAVFVLYKAEAAYDFRGESNTFKASLSTSSPGLVIITLSTALAVATLYAKSNVTDQADFDLAAPAPTESAERAASASTKPRPIERSSEEDFRRQLQQTLHRLKSSPTPHKEEMRQ